jgi:hypothetical protein
MAKPVSPESMAWMVRKACLGVTALMVRMELRVNKACKANRGHRVNLA